MKGRILNAELSVRLRAFLSRAGFNVRLSSNARPLDLTTADKFNPISALYEANGRSALVRLPLDSCIFFSHLAFPCVMDGPSPQIKTLLDYAAGRCNRWDNSDLVSFYQRFRPLNAAELMGLDNPSNSELLSMPAGCAFLPWESRSPKELLELEKKSAVNEARQFGRSSDVLGSQFYGPNAEEKIRLEYDRLVAAYESLRRYGHNLDFEGFGNVRALIIGFQGCYKAFILVGHHRMAALSALGAEDVVLQIGGVGFGGYVGIEHAEHFPAVQRGLISKREAEIIFERIYHAEQPWLY